MGSSGRLAGVRLARPVAPTFREERMLRARGLLRVAGVDEAGRGPLAGPVVAAAAMLPPAALLPPRLEVPWLGAVRDSKELSAEARETFFGLIHDEAMAIGVGSVDAATIDDIGIVPATRRAMKAAVDGLDPPPESLLIDFLTLPDVRIPQKGIVKGDTLCLSIACASIIAKVTRDRIMIGYDREYPGYGFRQHKGYGTPRHLACLRRLGPCPIHRRSFQPVKDTGAP